MCQMLLEQQGFFRFSADLSSAEKSGRQTAELQSKIHSEVEASKKEMRRKLAKEFTEEQREDLRQEVKEELTILRTENEELSAENKDLIIERNREAEESLKLKQELDKRNGQYAKLFDLARNQQQSLEKVVGENKALKKETGH
ncbi:hypothetical protein [Bacillus atrophaeus]|uniref:hypothetical protein n=1 Tax=Bacillus atrophaeus TaxID=1452 RepID=UPI00255C249C|nr:hypothetical protein [Bacillus atrophaeus]MDL5144258.1 hypothetical protein [Bacillus atrophaeus]